MLNTLFHKAFIRSNPCNSNWLRQASDRDYHLLSGLFPKLLSCCCQCLGASAGTAFASAQLLKKRKKKERKKGEVYSAWQGPPYIFTVTPRGPSVVALRKKLCHCSVRECVSGLYCSTAQHPGTWLTQHRQRAARWRDAGDRKRTAGRQHLCESTRREQISSAEDKPMWFCTFMPLFYFLPVIHFHPVEQIFPLLLALTLVDYITTI